VAECDALAESRTSSGTDLYDRFGIPVDWGVGDIVVICNYRFAHGRPGIHLAAGEERELGVLIGEAFARIGHLDDKW
jgi:hypothetical protein